LRVGINPNLDNKLTEINKYHRIIVPVYIPSLVGYFSDSLTILKYCLESLRKTIHDSTSITIIDNSCCDEVKQYLAEEFRIGWIDQIIINKNDVGKIDSIMNVIRGCFEPLITITDSDVLFLDNWQIEVEDIHNAFKNCGVVGPVPSSRAALVHTYSTWLYGLLRGLIKFEKVEDANGLVMFAKSIGNDNLYYKCHLEQILIINKNGKKATVGCGHFVATYKREVFDYSPKVESKVKLGGNSENLYFDIPNDKIGCLRLATLKNFAYHLGNKNESWMQGEVNSLGKQTNSKYNLNDFLLFKNRFAIYFYRIRSVFFYKFFKTKFFKQKFSIYLGLQKSSRTEYFY